MKEYNSTEIIKVYQEIKKELDTILFDAFYNLLCKYEKDNIAEQTAHKETKEILETISKIIKKGYPIYKSPIQKEQLIFTCPFCNKKFTEEKGEWDFLGFYHCPHCKEVVFLDIETLKLF